MLQPITDPERRFRQMPSEMIAQALPEATPSDARMKKIFMNNCTGCHPPGYILQFRFDEAGWSKVIDLMKVVPGTGVYPGPNAQVNAIMDRNQKELAAYLSRARGPGETSMKFPARARPTGEAARAVWKIYDLPLNPDVGVGVKYNDNDGLSNWALGQPSKLAELPHDGSMGLDGNLYYTVNNPNTLVTIGKVDTKTGEVTYFKVDARDGNAATVSRAGARCAGELLVRHQPGPPRPGQARSEGRQDHRLPDAGRHDAGWRRRDDRRRRPGEDLGVDARGRGAVRSGDGEVHRVPVGDVEEPERDRRRPTARRATATATAGGRRWRSTRSATRT